MPPPSFIAFEGTRRLASGSLSEVALQVKTETSRNEWASVLIFDDRTSHVIEVDLRGSAKEVLKRLEQHPQAKATSNTSAAETDDESAPRGVGRPKLGVIAREVTLLPRHWEWLGQQSGGASVALRKLVEEARHANAAKDQQRQAQEATYRFMAALAGNEAGFEEATRSLFANDAKRFEKHTQPWPEDLRQHARHLAAAAFGSSAS